MHPLDDKIETLVARLGSAATQTKNLLVTAESCTGGLLAGAVTEVPGSSGWFEKGFVTYATPSKTQLLGVRAELIEHYGVVSEQVAHAMARGALAQSATATMSVGITGYAGPSGGEPDKPVGTVCIGWGYRFNEHVVTLARTVHIPGNRSTVRRQSVVIAIEGLLEMMLRYGNPVAMPSEF